MNDTNAPTFVDTILQNTGMENFWSRTSTLSHVAIIVGIAFAVHLIVKIIRHISEWFINRHQEKKSRFSFVTGQPKFITLTRLIVSAVTFLVYAMAILLILVAQFGQHTENILKTYLTGAAVIGLALSFGLQGLVQDVVTGLTLIFSDAMDIGDIVDLGTIGRVEWIGLRFTKLTNFYNQEVFVPNRNILNVSRFPRGGTYAYVDIQVPQKEDQQKMIEGIERAAQGMFSQFGAIILTEPKLRKVEQTPGGWNFVRIQFQIWPGQNAFVEGPFRQQLINTMKIFDPNYGDWMITVTYRTIAKN
jgi:small-conductance mechanosensitive channel